MTIRPVAVLEEIRQSPLPRFAPSAPAFEHAMPVGNRSAPRHQGLTELELDSYQIALVHLPTRAGESDRECPTLSQLLFLPLTWNELLAQVRKEMGAQVWLSKEIL